MRGRGRGSKDELGRVFKVARLEKTVDVDVYVDELVEVGVAWPIEV